MQEWQNALYQKLMEPVPSIFELNKLQGIRRQLLSLVLDDVFYDHQGIMDRPLALINYPL
jgi:hypothetical protein